MGVGIYGALDRDRTGWGSDGRKRMMLRGGTGAWHLPSTPNRTKTLFLHLLQAKPTHLTLGYLNVTVVV